MGKIGYTLKRDALKELECYFFGKMDGNATNRVQYNNHAISVMYHCSQLAVITVVGDVLVEDDTHVYDDYENRFKAYIVRLESSATVDVSSFKTASSLVNNFFDCDNRDDWMYYRFKNNKILNYEQATQELVINGMPKPTGVIDHGVFYDVDKLFDSQTECTMLRQIDYHADVVNRPVIEQKLSQFQAFLTNNKEFSHSSFWVALLFVLIAAFYSIWMVFN